MTTRSGKQFRDVLSNVSGSRSSPNDTTPNIILPNNTTPKIIKINWGQPSQYSQSVFREMDRYYAKLLRWVDYYQLRLEATSRYPFIQTEAFEKQRRAELLSEFFALYRFATQLPGVVYMNRECGMVYVQALNRCAQILKIAVDLKKTYSFPEFDKIITDFDGVVKKIHRMPNDWIVDTDSL